MERTVKKLSKLVLDHPELAKAISRTASSSAPSSTSANADDAASSGAAKGDSQKDPDPKDKDVESIASVMSKKPATPKGDDLDSSDSSDSVSPRHSFSTRPSTKKRSTELAQYAALDAKHKQLEISLRQISPFADTERKTLEAFIVARRLRRGTRPGNGPSLGVVFYGDPRADTEFFDVFERFIVVHADGSTNWSVISVYIAEYITWFNNLAADLANYTLSELRDAWLGNDLRSSGTRNDLWGRAKEIAGNRPAAAKGTPCPFCGIPGHSFARCIKRKEKLKEEQTKLSKSEGGSKSDSDTETTKASSKKKASKKSS